LGKDPDELIRQYNIELVLAGPGQAEFIKRFKTPFFVECEKEGYTLYKAVPT
jgi:hypothetical protein